MDAFIITVLFAQFFTFCSASWYMAIRPVYDLQNRTLALNRIQRTPKRGREPIRHCRKDKQCEKGKFCYRQMGTCHACRWGGQLCKRNHMCCKGYACVAGFCKPIQQSGAEGSFCRKTKDCQRGLCCTKTTIGQKVCRRFLKEGDACNLIESSFFRSANYCACGAGLKCKKVRRISNRVRGNPGWLHKKDRRCTTVT